MAPAALIKHACDEFDRLGHYGVSVFGTVPIPDETEAETIDRLWQAAMTRLKPDPRYWICTEAGNLLDRGFVFIKDGKPDELQEHYCVSLSDRPPDESRAELLIAGFTGMRRAG